MRNIYSKVVFGLSLVGLLTTALFSLLWFSIVIDHDGRGGITTRSVVGPVLGLGLLALVVIPSALLYARWHQRRDLWSLALSGMSFVGVVGEIVGLYFVRLHGPW